MNTDSTPLIERKRRADQAAQSAQAQRAHELRKISAEAKAAQAASEEGRRMVEPLIKTAGRIEKTQHEIETLETVRGRQEMFPAEAERARAHRSLRKRRFWLRAAIAAAAIMDGAFVLPNLVSSIAAALNGGKAVGSAIYLLSGCFGIMTGFILLLLKLAGDVQQCIVDVESAMDEASLQDAQHRLFWARICKVAGIALVTAGVAASIASEFGKQAASAQAMQIERANAEAEIRGVATEAGGGSSKSQEETVPFWKKIPPSAAVYIFIWALHLLMLCALPSGGGHAPLDHAEFAPELIEKRNRELDVQMRGLAQEFRKQWHAVQGHSDSRAIAEATISQRIWARALEQQAPPPPAAAAEPVVAAATTNSTSQADGDMARDPHAGVL